MIDNAHPAPPPSVVTTEARNDQVIRNLVDVTSLMILSATAGAPKTVRDLAVELNLPIASLYRKVRSLQTAGALFGEKIKDRATGKETMIYVSAVSGLQIRFAPDPRYEIDFRAQPAYENYDS